MNGALLASARADAEVRAVAEATGGAFWARAGTKASADAAARTMRSVFIATSK
jgi:hypothetical protein